MISVIGHDKILNYFDKVVETDNLSHAYIFSGPDHLGKKLVAENIAAKLFGVEVEKLTTQPDYIVVDQEINKNTDKLKKNIDVEQIRDLRIFLSQKGFLAGYKVAIINNAEKLNNNSANVILKTLEEPKGKTVLFIITRNYELLLPTIQSRCQIINFNIVSKQLIKNKLLDMGGNENLVDQIVRLSGGLPGLAINWMMNNESFEEYKKEIVRFITLFNRPFYEKLEKIEDIFGDKVDHIVARENLIIGLNIWQNVLRGLLHSNNGLIETKLKLKVCDKTILKIMNKLGNARIQLENNIHPRILVEQILLDIP
ncbi:MAG: hypothetical protein A2725_00830 [Candidatus Magasanikbacteria bacterium RIFCSPHIGHO2_01_FULL_33_34]|uniref:DNA polymerase III subunit delta n=1 Tax=Candidatus Magasanikbacteria bacterium RIFCSPHIGHO2_01_FULL_33_34 TaxID=1798671 RepID=A0A1F6LIX4_9BACT|nr:MAG: hypothetical protein A2725_00830 [Candidatus Magasanikbacteria bacterium RIFCSPHIGHO2_01_FULL_33_34]OGH65301.1 MAG: hypothetical protein A3B83_04490 [Candidatus Magasanikbacteria bacterium RIFCSPHIGHO2_02_FULL_33_17]OGH76078.1 MAG: hypothetical protein A3A89_01415 [Candidatus Magasanikbacteria bacterium RIFCSPLOWO2_01_FULL_33_34]OGH81751.1 MAG: hypothetical protein A3F93_00745 [Candidatus Magasanikbacteria bacterium RIFCSPLOWO2_12_FULL_34_7]